MEGSTGDNTKESIVEEILTITPYLASASRDDFKEFITSFGNSLPNFTEYSISPHDESLGIMTRGIGESFVQQVRDYLIKAGMNDNSIDLFNNVEKFFPGVSLLIKREFLNEKKFDFSLYWQYFVPIRILIRLARRFKISRQKLALFDELSLLMRSVNVFLGLNFYPPDKVSFRVFFSNSLNKSSSYIEPALAAIMAKAGLNARLINYFIGFHNFLSEVARGKIFTSLGFDGHNISGVKIDYEIIPPDYAMQVMQALDIPKQQQSRLREVMKIIRMQRLTYLGIKFTPNSPPCLKFYFDRRFSEKNLENSEILADFLRNTIWTQ